MTAIAHGRTVLDVLYLEECRSVVDTTTLGLGRFDNTAIDPLIQLSSVERHALLGTGSFGQVWLASIVDKAQDTKSEPRRRTVAFKVQAKHQILESGKAERMVAERNILASLNSPFLMRLYSSFQDESRLYMVTSFLQGGELESLIPEDGLSEAAAKFYAAGILEGIAYMHRRHLIHRDIKTTNVLLNERGYPVIIDFGFAKYVPDKTYTFVGSPIYTAPEIIRFQGYSGSVDYWAWGILVYRLVTGRYPFFGAEGDELALFKRICRGSLEIDGLMSMEFRLLISSLLYPDPDKRIGSGRNGWKELINAAWFSTDTTLDLRKLRRQKIKAPWVPELKNELDASSFHPNESEMEDLMTKNFPPVEDEQQKIFAPFGTTI
jgi:protein kinase A